MFQGRINRRFLPLATRKALQCRTDLAFGDIGRAADRGHPAGAVLGFGDHSQVKFRQIAFLAVEQEARQSRGLVDATDQYSGGEWIQRTGVSDFACLQYPFHPSDGLGRGHVRGLVQNDNAVIHLRFGHLQELCQTGDFRLDLGQGGFDTETGRTGMPPPSERGGDGTHIDGTVGAQTDVKPLPLRR